MFVTTIFSTIISVLITTAAFFNVQQDSNIHRSFVENAKLFVHVLRNNDTPCSKPIMYTVDTFDDRFGISKEEFSGIIDEATGVWNEAMSKKLFVRTPNGSLKANLIYDIRQEAQRELDAMDLILDAMEGENDALDAQYDRAARSVDKASIRKNQDVLTDKYNAMVDDYNALIMKRGGEGFVAGNYGESEKGKTLDIYVNGGREKLKRLLTHELGHALGLEHSDDPADIMYLANKSENEKPTMSDIAALEMKCGSAR